MGAGGKNVKFGTKTMKIGLKIVAEKRRGGDLKFGAKTIKIVIDIVA